MSSMYSELTICPYCKSLLHGAFKNGRRKHKVNCTECRLFYHKGIQYEFGEWRGEDDDIEVEVLRVGMVVVFDTVRHYDGSDVATAIVKNLLVAAEAEAMRIQLDHLKEYSTFLKRINKEPRDVYNFLVFGDWLDDRDLSLNAQVARAVPTFRKKGSKHLTKYLPGMFERDD